MTALVTPAPHGRSGRRVLRARVEARAAKWGRRAGTVAVTALLLVPFLPILLWAFADRWPYPELAPTVWGVGGWLTATAQGAWPALTRSLLLGLTVSAIATPLGAMAGRALARGRVPYGKMVTALLLAPVAVPPFAVTMGLTTVALRLGVPGVVALVAVLVVAAVPYTTYIMRAAYAGYDEGFEETARTLGAGSRHVLLRVHLPLVAPALAAAAFLAFLVGWSDYVVTLLIGAGRIVSLPLLLGASASASGNDPTIAVLALLATIPPVLLLTAVTVLSRRRTQR
ncbi:putative spermidine/putrescine transport system permease protein [Promicromonospora umidemergens]|uniref:ABC transporter permease subunit n=1 Tax=Promicromonospora umidemergens TaxID=629679 RepID=A0ABP8X035_9MICO|nr:ABC transporter permease subunit [Promicromonospora umidemergens]MCP2285549.1 putative spermidine/putrescine transport system permease protein [Promicromonospora umidemergens]